MHDLRCDLRLFLTRPREETFCTSAKFIDFFLNLLKRRREPQSGAAIQILDLSLLGMKARVEYHKLRTGLVVPTLT